MNIKKLNEKEWEKLKDKVNKLKTLSKYEIIPGFVNQKSFNKKAFIIFKSDFEILESYGTIIFIKDNTNLYYNKLEYKQSTTKHIKEFLKGYNTFSDININDNIKDIKKKFTELENINSKLDDINKYYGLDITTFNIETKKYFYYITEEQQTQKRQIIKNFENMFYNILKYLNIDPKYLEISNSVNYKNEIIITF